MSMVGADAEALEALAAHLDGQADALDRSYVQLSRQLGSSPWKGPSADRFRREWTQVHLGQKNLVRNHLREAAEALRHNARQQRDTSRASGGAAGGSSTGAGYVDRLTDVNRLRRDLLAVRGDPAAEAAWWASLSPVEQMTLLAQAPTALLALTGLPADVRAKAQAQAIEDLKDTIGIATDEVSVEVRATIPLPFKADIVLGGGVSAERTEYADGHVEVTLTAEQLLGVGLSAEVVSGMLGVQGKGSVTWSFEDRASADRFQRELTDAFVPKIEWDDAARLAAGSAVGGAAGGYVAAVAPDVAEVLNRYRSEVAHEKVGVAIVGELNAKGGGASVDLSAAVGAERDLKTGETTVSFEADGKVQGSLGPFSGARAAETKVELTLGSDGAPKEFAVSGSFSASTGFGLPAGMPVGASGMIGSGGSYSLTVDLTDPVLAQDVNRFVSALKSGDVDGAARSFESLRNAGSMVVQSNVVNTNRAEVDLVLGEGSIEHQRTAAMETWVKPAYGSFQQLAVVPSSTGRSDRG